MAPTRQARPAAPLRVPREGRGEVTRPATARPAGRAADGGRADGGRADGGPDARAARDGRDAQVVRGGGWVPVRPPVVSTGSAERFAERVAMRRRLSRRRMLIVGTVVVVVAAVGWLLLISPVLALHTQDVEVRGEGTVVDPAAVRTVVEGYQGTPLPRLDTVGMRRAILDVPGVRAAEVARVWPHGLRVTLVSREPVAAVPQAGGAVVLLDVDGVQVGRADAVPEGLPVVDVPLDAEDARVLTAVLTVLQRLPEDLLAEVTTVAAATQDTVTFTLQDGARVEWGSADETALKAEVLGALRRAEASSGAAVYDVSAPRLPITRS
ncbi:cell division protein FtsQ/DivIB [Actinotalea sp. K2]|uniref:cell division protein FtsQ/DivIB n=1 Tax=Actinotalea sp. K2 TaxID=2939438 RepID=UPI002017DE08|nr:cell division protein FtsQ/DivIB [Actinotalea sp. K2]MCL3860119.1 cell division protein FtsQ/DivIB [Actinotalea sp. K2]